MAAETYPDMEATTNCGARILAPGVGPEFSLSTVGDDDRGAIESYISATFLETYGARLYHFMPVLLARRDDAGLVSALGIRRADTGPLFLEQYLDQPVESALAAATGSDVARRDIAEIGNLVSTSRGGSRLLFLMLAELFAAAEVTWAIFTATPEVRRLLHKLTGNQFVLCQADGLRLGDRLADWGSYYDTRPAVTAINVAQERRELLSHPLARELLQSCAAPAQQISSVLRELQPCN